MQKPSDLNAKLKHCESEIKEYVRALQTENAKLQRRIAKLEVNNLSLNNRIKALKKELKEKPPAIRPFFSLPEGSNLRMSK